MNQHRPNIYTQAWNRMIAHVDMNAFFCSCEQQARRELRDKPIGVTNGMQGTTIITSSYEARRHRIFTGTKVYQAKRLCPAFIQVASRPHYYADISTRIMNALHSVNDKVEIFSVDEAFIDLTDIQHLYHYNPYELAMEIKQAIEHSTGGLPCSIGIGGDKTIAKLAAKLEKPNGLTIIPPEDAAEQIQHIPIEKLCGVNKGIKEFLARYQIRTCGDMKKIPINVLAQRYGNPGRRIWLMAQALDPEPLKTNEHREPKSMSHGKMIPPHTKDLNTLLIYYQHMSEKVARRLRRHQMQCQEFLIGAATATDWLKKSYKTTYPVNDGPAIFQLCQRFLQQVWQQQGVFQVLVSAQAPQPEFMQQDLFFQENFKRHQINLLIDQVNCRYGEFSLYPSPLVNRTSMPNVIAPAWRPGDGIRNTINY